MAEQALAEPAPQLRDLIATWHKWATAEDTRPIPRRLTARAGLVIAVAISIALWSAWGVMRHDAFGTFGFDFGIFDQGMWLLSRFHDPFITIMGVDLFGDHTSFILLPLVPLYWLFPSPVVLIVAQAAAGALAAVPLFLIARDKLRSEWLALGVAIALLANPVLHWSAWEQFHPDIFEVPLALWALYFMFRQRWVPFLVFAFLLLMVKEDVALMTAVLGIYVARKYDLRIGLITAAGSVLYFLGALWVILPGLNGQGTLDAWRVPYGGLGGLLERTFTKPWDVIALALGEDKPWYLWQLFASFGLLSFVAPSIAVVAVGPLASNLLSTFWYQYHVQYHYTTLITPVLAVAAVVGISRFQRDWVRRVGVGVLLASCLVTGWLWGPSQLSRNPEYLGDSTEAHVRPILDLLALIPDAAPVAAHYSFITHLGHRREIYEWPTPWYAANWGDGRQTGALLPEAANVEYIVVPLTALNARDLSILQRLEGTEFERVGQTGQIVLLKRSSGARTLDDS